MEYILLQSKNKYALQEEVKKKLEEGYKLQGSIQLVLRDIELKSSYSNYRADVEYLYTQAMVKGF